MPFTPTRFNAPRLRWLVRTGTGSVLTSPRAMRLGILSGTFNPPTLAHLQMAEAAAQQLQLVGVLFVIPETLPHKAEPEIGLARREEMLRRALVARPRFSAAVSTHGLLIDIHFALASRGLYWSRTECSWWGQGRPTRSSSRA